jgi:hypothetical protein
MARTTGSFKKGHKVNLGKKNNCCFTKLKNHGLLEQAYKSYCDHLANGNMRCSWYFEHEKVKVCYEAFESYFEKYPEEFDEMDRKIAWSKGYGHWENKLTSASNMPARDTNPAVLQMVMRNKFKWDTEKHGPEKAPEQFDTQLKILKQVNGEWHEA